MRSNEPEKNRTHKYVKVVLGLALLFAVGALASGALGQATEGTGTGTDTTATDTTAVTTTDATTTTDTTATTIDASPTDPPPAAPASSPLSPTISSDQADYPPGGTVTLTGSGWGPGESVHLFVNDSAGDSWSYNVDVTADAFGGLTNTFNLPNWFVANYSVTASGAAGETATSSFTDSVNLVSVTSPTTAVPLVSKAALPTNVTINFDYKTSAGTTSGVASVKSGATTIASASKSLPAATGGASDSITVSIPSGTVDGSYDVAVTVTNNNSMTDTQTAAVKLDHLAPIAPTVSGTTPVSPANNNSPSVNGTAEAGSTVKIYTNSTCTSAVAGTGTATGGNFGISVSVGDNSTSTFFATATDAATNVSGCSSTSASYVEDSAAPALPTNLATTPTSPNASTTPSVTGRAELSSTVKVYTNVTCTGTVAGTGAAASTGVGAFSIPVTVATGSTTTFYATATDAAGNASACSTASATYVQQSDITPPTITYTINGNSPPVTSDGDNGWWKSNVTLHWIVTENESPGSLVKTGCVDQSITSDQSATSYSCSASSTGGSAGPVSVTIKRDATAPTISDQGPTAAADGSNGWYVSAVTNQFKAVDSLSGLSAACVTAFPVSGSDNIRSVSTGTQEGLAVKVASGACTDQAGNSASSIDSAGFKVDLTDPSISFTGQSPAKNGNGWNNADVTLSWSCSDTGSGTVAATVSKTVTTEGSGQQKTGTCTDNAGRTSSSTDGNVNIDKTAPTIGVLSVKSNGVDYTAPAWTNHDVVVTFACTDNGPAGVDALTTPVTKVEGADQTASGNCTDKAGNSAATSVEHINVDKTAPTSITFSGGITDGSIYPVLSVPANDSCDANFDISGKQSCVVTGYGTAIGSYTLTATATDKAGNQSTRALHYVVGFQNGNVLPPVTAPSGDQTNPLATDLQAFKIKSVIPVKFQMFLDSAKTQLMTTPPVGSTAKLFFGKADSTTDTVDTADLITGSANTGNIFRWTGSPDYQYIYNMSTTGQQSGTYYVYIMLYAADGTTVLAQSPKQYFVLRS
jgi:hypothetical protein